MGVYISYARLPSTYQEVEYIQSSGTQYINTGYNPVSTTKVQAKVMVTGYRENGGPIYGVWYNYSGATRFCGWYENGGVWFGYGGNNGANNIVQCSTNTILNIEQYTSSGASHNIVNGTDNSYTGASFSTQNYPIYLFARNNGASDIDKRLDTRIYSFKIYTGDTLVRNFIPCYRKSDSVIGMYDLVNNQFYTNSGSGTFSKGNDVTMAEMKNAYIGEYIPSSGLLGYRPLQSDLKDLSGNGNDGSWYSGTGSFGTVGDKTGARVTNQGSSYYLSTQHVVTPVTYNSTNITMCGWVYFSSTTINGPWNGLFSNDTSSNPSSRTLVGIRGGSYGNNVYLIRNGSIFGSLQSPSTGTWYFWTITDNGTNVKFYLNGSLSKTYTSPGTTGNGGVYRIGVGTYDHGGWGGTNGYVRHCAIYNRELTADEILKYYNLTA